MWAVAKISIGFTITATKPVRLLRSSNSDTTSIYAENVLISTLKEARLSDTDDFAFDMPTTFDQQSYWHNRFATETSFEWLVPSAVFMSILEPHLDNLDSSSKILQIGFGTSDLQTHLRARGFTNILNIDFEPLAIEHGKRLEKQIFGNVQMYYEVADATQLNFKEAFDLVIDKSTVDAVSCGGDEVLMQMVKGVKASLAPAGLWVSLSYSSSRFDLDSMPFDVEVEARIPTAKRKGTDPDIFHWCYLLRPSSDRCVDG